MKMNLRSKVSDQCTRASTLGIFGCVIVMAVASCTSLPTPSKQGSPTLEKTRDQAAGVKNQKNTTQVSSSVPAQLSETQIKRSAELVRELDRELNSKKKHASKKVVIKPESAAKPTKKVVSTPSVSHTKSSASKRYLTSKQLESTPSKPTKKAVKQVAPKETNQSQNRLKESIKQSTSKQQKKEVKIPSKKDEILPNLPDPSLARVSPYLDDKSEDVEVDASAITEGASLFSSLEQLPLKVGEAWTLDIGQEGSSSQCQVKSKAVTMSDGQGDTPVELIIDAHQVLVKTRSNIDLSYPKDGLQLDQSMWVEFEQLSKDEMGVVVKDRRDDFIAQLKTAKQLKVHLGFWPTWPVTQTYSVAFDVSDMKQIEQHITRCNAMLGYRPRD